MLKILKNCELYSPSLQGKKDLLIADTRIASIADTISMKDVDGVQVEVIDCSGKLVIPGLIDSHVHLIGGGGEGSFKSRTPEVRLEDLLSGGVTTVVGCLGTDGITRSMEALYAKAKGLEEEGVSTYLYSGSYRLPPTTLTGSIMKDLILIDKVIGAGEIALSDHRSSQPTMDQLRQLAADARVGGLLSGKAGVVCFHIGSGSGMLTLINEIIRSSELTYDQFVPTHINRSEGLLEEGIKYAKQGGFIDFTTSSNSVKSSNDQLNAAKCLKLALDAGVSGDRITFTSDGQGSLPVFDQLNRLTGLEIGKVSSLFQEFQNAVLIEKLPVEVALKPVTCNPATLLHLKKKGRLEVGFDADLVILNKKELTLDTILAMGQILVSGGEIKVHGTFSTSV